MSLHRDRFSFNRALSPGVYRCEIPDASGTSQNIYVGIIYPLGGGEIDKHNNLFRLYSVLSWYYNIFAGSPSITSLLFDRNSTTLTCTSTGSPPTTVTWRKNGVRVDLSLYEQSQRLVDAVQATYHSILFSDNITNFVGTFTCVINNARVSVPIQSTLELNGIILDCFIIPY